MTSNQDQTTTPKKRGRGRPRKIEVQEKRPTRVPISGDRLKMEVPEEAKDPNYFYYWFNDVNNDVYHAKRAGYVHVQKEELPYTEFGVDTSESESSIVSMRVGRGVTAFLMKQPMEYRNEDQAAYNARVDKSELAMKEKLNSGQDGQYGKVTID